MSATPSTQPAATNAASNDRRPVPVKLVLLGIYFKQLHNAKNFFTYPLNTNLGESAVGKSSLVIRFVNREYTDNREPTIGGMQLKLSYCRL